MEGLIIQQSNMVLGLERQIRRCLSFLLCIHIMSDCLEIFARFVDRLEEQIPFDIGPADLWGFRLDGRFLGALRIFGGI